MGELKAISFSKITLRFLIVVLEAKAESYRVIKWSGSIFVVLFFVFLCVWFFLFVFGGGPKIPKTFVLYEFRS